MKRKQVAIKIDKLLLDRLKVKKASTGKTIVYMIREAIETYLEKP